MTWASRSPAPGKSGNRASGATSRMRTPSQIMHNVTGFFGVLAEWSRAERLAAANDAAAPAKPNEGEVRHDR